MNPELKEEDYVQKGDAFTDQTAKHSLDYSNENNSNYDYQSNQYFSNSNHLNEQEEEEVKNNDEGEYIEIDEVYYSFYNFRTYFIKS